MRLQGGAHHSGSQAVVQAPIARTTVQPTRGSSQAGGGGGQGGVQTRGGRGGPGPLLRFSKQTRAKAETSDAVITEIITPVSPIDVGEPSKHTTLLIDKMTLKRARSTGRSVTASKRSKIARTQAEETNDKLESPSYLDVLADQARVVAKNEAASSQMQQDDALEAKEASQVDGDDSSQEQTESGHASKHNEDREDYEDGEGDNEDGQDDENDNEDGEDDDNNNEYGEDDDNEDNDNGDGEDKNSDDDENTTIADDKTEEENDENVHFTPAEASTSGRDPSITFTYIVVKTIRFENYNLKMLMDVQGDIVVRSSMGRGFTEFRKIVRENDLVKFFKSSCFGKYLDLPNDTTARFQMTMVYSLLRRRIICEKKYEIWINYCGMPVCFGMKDFAVMTELNCHSPPRVGGANSTTKGEDLFKLVGKNYKKKNLLEHLKSKIVSRNVKKSLCLVWFVHSVLCARDAGKNISSDWIKLSADYEAFNAYPWGRESFKLTVEYLLRELKANVKTINLYGFPWAFMAWAFEVIPHLRHQVKDFPKEVSSPRILRWLATKNNKAVGVDLLYPLRDSYIDAILCLMRIRHIDYPKHYNPTDIILDLNFYNFMKDVYAKLSEESLQPGAIQLKQRLDNHDFIDYFLDYCKGVRPYPGGVPWLGAKRFYTVMTIERKHFVALEIMIDDGVINVYDCNIPCCSEEEFFLHIQPVKELWPRFLK